MIMDEDSGQHWMQYLHGPWLRPTASSLDVVQRDRSLALRLRQYYATAEEEFDAGYRRKIEWLAGRGDTPPNDRADIGQDVLASGLDQTRRGPYREDSTFGTWLQKLPERKSAEPSVPTSMRHFLFA